MPPVSTSSTKRLPTLTRLETRSRVTPAVGSTMAMRRPASQLNSDDLPTLGRPTMATTGTATVHLFGFAVGGLSGGPRVRIPFYLRLYRPRVNGAEVLKDE